MSKKRRITTAPAATEVHFPFPLTDRHGGQSSFEKTFESVVQLLQGRKNIVVLVGAGISVSCGIPDFRSRESGLYSTLDIEKLGLSCPEDLFDLAFFQDEPGPFYEFAKHLYFPKGQHLKVEPSDSHKLLALLEQKKMLLRVYSQNIDGLEQEAGVSRKKMVYAHGSLRWATCTTCQKKVSSEDIMPDIKQGIVAKCKAERTNKRTSVPSSNSSLSSTTNTPTSSPREPLSRLSKRPRVASDDFCGGVMKPGVTFFGESLNDSVRRSLEADRDKVDALIVIGTSLSVAPISKVIEYLPTGIPRILINRTIVHPSMSSQSTDDVEKDPRENYVFDAYLLGYCDDVTRCMAKKLFQDEGSNGTAAKKRKGKVAGSLLSKVVKGEDEDYKAEDWEELTVPPERVLLFPGALPSHHDTSEEVAHVEVAHCDGCSKRIRGTIQKCSICFDYDLCMKCFPTLSKVHYNGAHRFNSEKLK